MIAGLTEPDQESEAREAIRGLIEKIVATPVPGPGKRNRLELTLHDLAGVLALSRNANQAIGQQKLAANRRLKKV